MTSRLSNSRKHIEKYLVIWSGLFIYTHQLYFILQDKNLHGLPSSYEILNNNESERA